MKGLKFLVRRSHQLICCRRRDYGAIQQSRENDRPALEAAEGGITLSADPALPFHCPESFVLHQRGWALTRMVFDTRSCRQTKRFGHGLDESEQFSGKTEVDISSEMEPCFSGLLVPPPRVQTNVDITPSRRHSSKGDGALNMGSAILTLGSPHTYCTEYRWLHVALGASPLPMIVPSRCPAFGNRSALNRADTDVNLLTSLPTTLPTCTFPSWRHSS